MADLPLPPPPPALHEVAPDAPAMLVPLARVQWLGRRSVYADQLEALAIDLRADLLDLTATVDDLRLQSESNAALVEHWEHLARREHRRPGWGVVAGAGLAGVVAGGVGMAWALR